MTITHPAGRHFLSNSGAREIHLTFWHHNYPERFSLYNALEGFPRAVQEKDSSGDSSGTKKVTSSPVPDAVESHYLVTLMLSIPNVLAAVYMQARHDLTNGNS